MSYSLKKKSWFIHVGYSQVHSFKFTLIVDIMQQGEDLKVYDLLGSVFVSVKFNQQTCGTQEEDSRRR